MNPSSSCSAAQNTTTHNTIKQLHLKFIWNKFKSAKKFLKKRLTEEEAEEEEEEEKEEEEALSCYVQLLTIQPFSLQRRMQESKVHYPQSVVLQQQHSPQRSRVEHLH
jgi:hypothetical protein